MSDNIVASDEQGNVLLAEMEKTIPQKTAVCAAHMLLDDGAVVLDAGCADGVATAYFALTNPKIRVIGIDYDAGFIRHAKEKYGHIENLEFIVDDLRSFDLGTTKLDAIVNLSILHEPYSYTGYRKKTVEEIILAELANLKPGGVIINRDFVLPNDPERMVYMALEDECSSPEASSGDPEAMSYPELLKLYAREAMAFDNGDPQGHIKGFFLEEHTERIDFSRHQIPDNWRVFYLPHGFAWEFVWRKEYRGRFYPEANEKYGFWNSQEHRRGPENLGARVTYHAHYENPWILKNWYQPRVILLDERMSRLPLPPSNFLSVLQKVGEKESLMFREHKSSVSPPQYLQLSSFKNTKTEDRYDLVSRPGGDVVDVIPFTVKDGRVTVYAKYNYPRPLVNVVPRMMTANLDAKSWSGHVIEALATAGENSGWLDAVREVLTERAGFERDETPPDECFERGLVYYTSPSELNERVASAFVDMKKESAYDRVLDTRYSGFSSDGSVRSFDANSLLSSAQVGMLPEARLELNVYQLFQHLEIIPHQWIGEVYESCDLYEGAVSDFSAAIENLKNYSVFEREEEACGWLDIVRSEFHEVSREGARECARVKREIEFAVPNPKNSAEMSTNCISCLVLVKHAETGEYLLGFNKVSERYSQYPAVQERESCSALLHIPKHRLPSHIEHVQQLPQWIAERYKIDDSKISKLGESYFPSLGISPDRVFPYLLLGSSDELAATCDFFSLREVFKRIGSLQDMHSMVAINRVVHALDVWKDYSYG